MVVSEQPVSHYLWLKRKGLGQWRGQRMGGGVTTPRPPYNEDTHAHRQRVKQTKENRNMQVCLESRSVSESQRGHVSSVIR